MSRWHVQDLVAALTREELYGAFYLTLRDIAFVEDSNEESILELLVDSVESFLPVEEVILRGEGHPENIKVLETVLGNLFPKNEAQAADLTLELLTAHIIPALEEGREYLLSYHPDVLIDHEWFWTPMVELLKDLGE